MAYLKSKNLRNLQKTDLKITAVYPAYRTWWVEVNWKFVWKTFKVVDWKFKEQKWNNDERKFELVDSDIKIDKNFFSIYKKTFDVAFEVKSIMEVDGKIDNAFIIPLSSSKVKDILRVFVEDIPMNWDKEAFDWEDWLVQNLVWNFIRFTVTWTGLDTKYTYKEWKAFSSEEIDFDNIPF